MWGRIEGRKRRGRQKMRQLDTWPHTPVFMPGESHGQRSLVDYSPWGRKKSDTTEAT